MDAAQARVDAAQARVDGAKADVRAAQARLERARIEAADAAPARRSVASDTARAREPRGGANGASERNVAHAPTPHFVPYDAFLSAMQSLHGDAPADLADDVRRWEELLDAVASGPKRGLFSRQASFASKSRSPVGSTDGAYSELPQTSLLAHMLVERCSEVAAYQLPDGSRLSWVHQVATMRTDVCDFVLGVRQCDARYADCVLEAVAGKAAGSKLAQVDTYVHDITATSLLQNERYLMLGVAMRLPSSGGMEVLVWGYEGINNAGRDGQRRSLLFAGGARGYSPGEMMARLERACLAFAGDDERLRARVAPGAMSELTPSAAPIVPWVPLDGERHVFFRGGVVRKVLFNPGHRDQWRTVSPEAEELYRAAGGRVFRLRDGAALCVEYPFIAGSHAPSTVAAAVAAIVALSAVHERNIVHGDIRLANIVFTEPPHRSAHLIDFDFANREGSGVYPPGLRLELNDGVRAPEVAAEGPMMRSHDCAALAGALAFFEAVDAACDVAWLAALGDLLQGRLREALEALAPIGDVELRERAPAQRVTWLTGKGFRNVPDGPLPLRACGTPSPPRNTHGRAQV